MQVVDMSGPKAPQPAQEFLAFVNAAPSPFHAVHESRKRLEKAGFTEIKERDSWKLDKGGKYFFTRNQSSIVAFVVGNKFKSGNGFSIIGAHTDSPCPKIKPISKKDREGYLQVGVELYGGGIWHSWFDRDLSVAGRVLVNKDNKYHNTLVKIDRPILRIPTLAIHLDRAVHEGFKFNTETHMTPIFATATKAALDKLPNPENLSNAERNHHPAFISMLAEELNVKASQIEDFELCVYDTQKSVIGGAFNEFIFSPRLDNLEMSYCSLMSLINTAEDAANEPNIRIVALFDNEEVGSTTAHGANSNLLQTVIQRLSRVSIGGDDVSTTAYEEALHKSYLLSADMAHAVHPNYSEKHEDNHKPKMHNGVVIKINTNQRYATTAPTAFMLKHLARKHDIPIQEFVVRNDSPCGSTIGPMLSAKLGMRTIDVGNPQLSMHSVREQAGVEDVGHAIRLFEAFFREFAEVDAQVVVD